MTDVGTWEAIIGTDGVEHAFAVSKDSTPEQAVELAMARAAQKYGEQSWTRWNFRAEWCSVPAALRTVHFAWVDGALQRK